MKRSNFRIMKLANIAVLFVCTLTITTGCYTRQLFQGDQAEISREPVSGADPEKPIRVVVLVLAQPIAITQGDQQDLRADWFPVELVVGDPRFAILFNDLEPGGEGVDENGENRAALLDTLPNRLIQAWGPGKHPYIQYRRYLNLAEYQADAGVVDPRGSGRLVVRLYGFGSRTNNLILLSCLTAMIVPFYTDEAVYTETFFVSRDNRVQNLNKDRPAGYWPEVRNWYGWLFFLWGPLVAADAEAILSATVDAHIRAAGETGIFVPASSRINL